MHTVLIVIHLMVVLALVVVVLLQRSEGGGLGIGGGSGGFMTGRGRAHLFHRARAGEAQFFAPPHGDLGGPVFPDQSAPVDSGRLWRWFELDPGPRAAAGTD